VIRLFVAIPLPADIRARLGLLSGGIPGAAWVEPENLHLTLRFIGEVEEPAVAEIAAALETVEAAPFSFALDGMGDFGSGKRLRALWVGVALNEALDHLQARIESALVRLGLEPEHRRFTPHVTLARLKGAPAHRARRYIMENGAFRAGPFPVQGFTLFSSFLSRNGAIHDPVAEFALTDSL
jgi:2'-5' RNA ligase